jgi:hypothetical protein
MVDSIRRACAHPSSPRTSCNCSLLHIARHLQAPGCTHPALLTWVCILRRNHNRGQPGRVRAPRSMKRDELANVRAQQRHSQCHAQGIDVRCLGAILSRCTDGGDTASNGKCNVSTLLISVTGNQAGWRLRQEACVSPTHHPSLTHLHGTLSCPSLSTQDDPRSPTRPLALVLRCTMMFSGLRSPCRTPPWCMSATSVAACQEGRWG